jgi:hypothetical protein
MSTNKPHETIQSHVISMIESALDQVNIYNDIPTNQMVNNAKVLIHQFDKLLPNYDVNFLVKLDEILQTVSSNEKELLLREILEENL